MDGNNQNSQNQQSYNQQNYQQADQQQYNAQQQYEAQQQYYQQQYVQQQPQQQYAQQQYIQPRVAGGNNDGGASGGNGKGKKTGLIIGIIVAVAVIVAIIIVMVVLKNKKDDKKDSDNKKTTEATTDVNDTEEATTETLSTEEITEEATTEEASGERYYKLINIINDKDTDYVALLEDLNNEGKYNFGVFNYDDHTGYIVVAGAILGSEFTFDDTSITMDGEKSDMVIDGDNLSINYSGETLEFVSISYEEFAVMNEAINSVIVMQRGETTTEDIVFPYEDINVTIPEGFTLLGSIDSGGYTDNIHCQKSDEKAGVVVSYFVYIDSHRLSQNGKTIQDCIDEWGFEDQFQTVDFKSENGVDIYWLGVQDNPNEYMSDGFADGSSESKYCHQLDYYGYFEYNDNAYAICLYVDADYYGDEAENVAMEILNGISYR